MNITTTGIITIVYSGTITMYTNIISTCSTMIVDYKSYKLKQLILS